MPVYRDREANRWRYEFDRVVDHHRQRTTKLLPRSWTRAQAEAYGRERDGTLYLIATGALKPEPLVSDAVAAYLEHRAPALKNRPVLERELLLCFDFYAGRPLSDLPKIATEYRVANLHLKPATIRNRIAYLCAACRWAWKHANMGEHDPAERVAMPTVRNARHRYITRKQCLQLARKITNLWVRAVVLVAFYSGMRLSECLTAQTTEQGWLLEDTKNGERRLVPIHPKVAYLARQWPPPIAARTTQGAFARACRALGHTDLRFHDLRHSAASALVNAGVDLFTVGAILGHKAPASTKRYSHLATATLDAAVRKIA